MTLLQHALEQERRRAVKRGDNYKPPSHDKRMTRLKTGRLCRCGKCYCCEEANRYELEIYYLNGGE